MGVILKKRIEFFDKLHKMLLKWGATESEAKKFVFQVENANIHDNIIFESIKNNLARWQVSEENQKKFMSQFYYSLDGAEVLIWEEPRDLTKDEEQLIYDFLKKYNAEFMFDDALNRDGYTKMDLLQFAKDDELGIKHLDSQIAIFQYIYYD